MLYDLSVTNVFVFFISEMLVFGIVAYDVVKKYFTGTDSKFHRYNSKICDFIVNYSP